MENLFINSKLSNKIVQGDYAILEDELDLKAEIKIFFGPVDEKELAKMIIENLKGSD